MTEAAARQLRQLPLMGCWELRPRELEFSEKIRTICRTCPMYGTSWSCPPAVGTVEQCRSRCLSYDRALLICTAAETEDITNLSLTLKTLGFHEEITDQAAALFESPFVLSASACSRCSSCTYCRGKPCIHPEQMRPCIESQGINLMPTLERLGQEFQYGGSTVLWYSLILYNE